jgi:hypothetical protein
LGKPGTTLRVVVAPMNLQSSPFLCRYDPAATVCGWVACQRAAAGRHATRRAGPTARLQIVWNWIEEISSLLALAEIPIA